MENFEGALEGQALPGPVVQRADMGLELPVCDFRQIRGLGKVLPQQAVGVLIGAAFPRMIRVGEVDRQVEFAFQFEGPGELAAVVQGQAPAFLDGQSTNRVRAR